MPPKRAVSTPRAPRHPSGKSASRPRTRRAAAVAAPVSLRGRLTSDHEKRELILAHSAMRRAKDPVQLMSVWAGVAASAVVVVIAWAWMFVPTVMSAFRSPLDPGTQEFLTDVDDAREHAAARDLSQTELGKQIREMTQEMDEITAKAIIQQQTLETMAEAIEGTSSTESGRDDLFAPSPSSID